MAPLCGLFCYAAFEITPLSLLRHWTRPVVAVDVSWGTVVAALLSTLGLLVADCEVPALRRTAEGALHRVRDTLRHHFGCGTIRI
ncbi:MAG TPA: DUF2177 family protein [Bradyrhizobium sp.]|nr:DUF2177 family protein [Bradyrhizobium sp.]